MRIVFSFILATYCLGLALAHEVRHGDIEVVHPRLILTGADAEQGKLVFDLVNHGKQTVQLVAAGGQDFDFSVKGQTSLPVVLVLTSMGGPFFEETMERVIIEFGTGAQIAVDAIVEFRP